MDPVPPYSASIVTVRNTYTKQKFIIINGLGVPERLKWLYVLVVFHFNYRQGHKKRPVLSFKETLVVVVLKFYLAAIEVLALSITLTGTQLEGP